MFQNLRLPIGFAVCVAAAALTFSLAGRAEVEGIDAAPKETQQTVITEPKMYDVRHTPKPAEKKSKETPAEAEETILSYDQYYTQLFKYEQYDESLASLLSLVGKELDEKNKKAYIDWLYGEESNNKLEHWGTAFILWAGETSYKLVDSGFMPKVKDASELWDYMTNTNCFNSYEFLTAKPFGINITAISPGDFVYHVDNDGNIVDVGLVYDVTDSSVTVVYGTGDRLTLTTYTAEDFIDPDCELRKAKLQRIIYPTNASVVLDYLLNDMGLCKAAAVGVMANMYKESDFSPLRIGDDGTSIGLCQWHSARWERLAVFCEENKRDEYSLMTQLDFLNYELQNYEAGLYNFLKYNIEDSREGAGQAASSFCLVFEKPDKIAEKAMERMEFAMNYVWYHYTDF